LEQLFAGRPINVEEMVTHLQQVASDLGLPFGERTMTFNSRHAQELGKWAEEQGRGEHFHRAVFRAYFADGKNIGNNDVLAQVSRSAGLSGSNAREIIKSRTFSQAVDDDWERSFRSGITAVPTFRMDEQELVGAQPASVLERFLLDRGVSLRTAGQST
jgi:predicted DsbA family dithiol-disulfide isomerase